MEFSDSDRKKKEECKEDKQLEQDADKSDDALVMSCLKSMQLLERGAEHDTEKLGKDLGCNGNKQNQDSFVLDI